MADLLEKYSGTIDVFVILESGRNYEILVDEDLGTRANKVYFRPSASHNDPGRSQKIQGTYSSNRPALIFDDGWWTGDSFRETVNFLKNQGYELEQIYGYFVNGEVSSSLKGSQEYFDTAKNILNRLPKPV